MTKTAWKKKVAAFALTVLPLLAFMWSNSIQYKALTGQSQFTPFSGWQIANNALYSYRFVDSAARVKPPKEYAHLDNIVTTYFDTSRDLIRHPAERLIASTVYMWDKRSPLQIYKNMQYQKDSTAGELKKWGSVGPLYKGYGSYLIRTYPSEYVNHFLWPNMVKYYAPPLEFLEGYNMGRDTVAEVAVKWFHYKDKKVTARTASFRVYILGFLPVLAGTMNAFFVIGFLFLALLGDLKGNSPRVKIIRLVACFWLIHFMFSVLTAPVTLRYQLFGLIVCTVFALFFIEHVYRAAFTKPVFERKQESQQLAMS